MEEKREEEKEKPKSEESKGMKVYLRMREFS